MSKSIAEHLEMSIMLLIEARKQGASRNVLDLGFWAAEQLPQRRQRKMVKLLVAAI